MSTEYYIITKDKAKAMGTFNIDEFELTDTPYWGYRVRAMTISAGWKPMLYAYHKVESASDYVELLGTENWEMYDEYSHKISMNDFIGIIEDRLKQPKTLKTEFTFLDKEGFTMFDYHKYMGA